METTYFAQFREALASAFPTVRAFEDMLSVSAQLEQSLDRIAPPGTYDERILAVLHWARQHGKERDLFNAALAQAPNNVDLQAVEPLLPPPSPLVLADDLDICYFQTGRSPFIDRHELRRIVKRLISADGPRLFAIEGEKQSGKTYSTNYLSHVTWKRNFKFVQIALKDDYLGQPITWDLIADDINRQMGLEPLTRSGDEAAPRHALGYVNTLTGKLQEMRNDTWWIVIDGWTSTVPEDVRDLVKFMVKRIQQRWNNVRLVLICDDTDAELISTFAPEHEMISRIEWRHIFEFVMRFRQQRGLKDDDDEIKRICTEIMRRVDDNSPERTRMIGLAAAEQCRLMMDH